MGGGYWVWWVREIISPFLQMNMVLLTLLSHDLQLVLEWFSAECETDGSKTTSESEVTVFTWVRPECPPGGRVCYLGVLFMSQWRVEHETNTWIDVESAVIQMAYRSVVVNRELSMKAKLLIYWLIYVPTFTFGTLGVMERMKLLIQAG